MKKKLKLSIMLIVGVAIIGLCIYYVKTKSDTKTAATNSVEHSNNPSTQNGKKKLVWLNSDTCPEKVITALNERLEEIGCDYYIDYQEENAYADDYQDKLVQMMNSGEQVDIFNIGGTEEENEDNRYLSAIDKGLLTPIEDFLYKDKKGKELYDIYDEVQWQSLTVDKHIYSYDWRCQPVADLCAFVNKEFADEWNIDVKNCSFEELLKKAEEVAKDQKSRSFYPVIWGDVPAPDNYWNDSDLMKQLDTYKQIITYQQNVRWQNSVKFFMYVKGEYLTECSDEEILLDTGTTAVRSTYKMVVCKDKYVPVTSNLIGIASWSDNAEEALDFIYRVNTDETIANILQYGVEGENYTLRDGKSVVNYAKPAFGSFGIQNKWITYPQLLEPSNKEDSYKNYIQEHIG